MLKRFTILKGIGKFHDCSFGGRYFEKNTIIFGHNTGGKSTLTDVFWSLKTGSSEILEGRKTFGFSGLQQITIVDDNNKTYNYPSAEWNRGFPNIEIFDTKFINENIFEGEEINFNHQQNLNRIIIGAQGLKLNSEINRLQKELNELAEEKKAKTKYFNDQFKREISFEDFQRLPNVKGIDASINEIQNTIETAKNQTKIQEAFSYVDTHLTNLISQRTKEILSQSLEIKADIVSTHILTNWSNPNHPKDFIQTGLMLTKDEQKTCVFCGQELQLHAKQLLKAYSQLFSKEYKELQHDISTAAGIFGKWNPLNSLEIIKNKLESIGIELNVDFINKQELVQQKELINTEFQNKAKDLAAEVSFAEYDDIIEKLKKIKVLIEVLKEKKIFKTEANIPELQKTIRRLELSKIRHTEEWNNFIDSYSQLDIKSEEKRNKREAIREKLQEHSQKIFELHFDTINKILDILHADFILSDFEPLRRLVGQYERIFTLIFFKTHKVSIDEESKSKPNFRNTLSDSDKRVLAFAFFYSQMLHDENLSEKIIVFDDPFSSFDSERRKNTVELLANIYLVTPEGEMIEKKPNQLIILTHEKEFFRWSFKRLEAPKALKIVPDGAVNHVKKSSIVDCDVYAEFIEAENKRSLKEIKEQYDSGKNFEHYQELCMKCRKIMESIFTRKYLFELHSDIASNKSIRSFCETLRGLKINDFDNDVKFKKFMFLCDNLNIELHDNGLSNEGQNTRAVIKDFLDSIKII